MHRRWWLVVLGLAYIGTGMSMKQQVINFLSTGNTRYAVNVVGSLVFPISLTSLFLLGHRRASQPSTLAAMLVAAFAGFWLLDYPRSLEKFGVFLIFITLVSVIGVILFVLGHVTLRVVVVTVLVSAGFIGTLTAASLINLDAALFAIGSMFIIAVLGYLAHVLVLSEKLERHDEKQGS